MLGPATYPNLAMSPFCGTRRRWRSDHDEMITLEQARTQRLEAELRRRMAAAARIDVSRKSGRLAKDYAIAAIDRILDQMALALPEELVTPPPGPAPGRCRTQTDASSWAEMPS
jgi:hypothetical protein